VGGLTSVDQSKQVLLTL